MATSGQFSCPPAGTFMTVYGQFAVAAVSDPWHNEVVSEEDEGSCDRLATEVPTERELEARVPVLPSSRSYGCFKRALDVLGASVCLVLTSPLTLGLMVLVRLDSSGPAIHRGLRIGQGGRFFSQYKLRTMVQDAPDLRNADGSTLASSDDPRVTRVGHFLRKTSLDELPQFLNIVRGEMSFVGPRPDPPDVTQLYRPGDFARLSVLPGLTGWAAVQGRNELPWERRRDLDVEYVMRRTMALDLRILFLTVKLVLTGRGVHSDDQQA